MYFGPKVMHHRKISFHVTLVAYLQLLATRGTEADVGVLSPARSPVMSCNERHLTTEGLVTHARPMVCEFWLTLYIVNYHAERLRAIGGR